MLGRRALRRLAVAASLILFPTAIAASMLPRPAAADTFTDPVFSTEVVATVAPYTLVGLAFAPDGRMFVWQKNGVVRIVKNGVLLPTPFINLSAKVNTFDDRGFWGLTFDPSFASNGYVYLSYTYEEGGNPNSTASKTSRLTRVTADPANPDVALTGSETVVLGSVGTPPCSAQPPGADCIAADGGSHTLGNLLFAADGTLLVGTGDGSDGDSLSLRAQDLNSYNGKILRINKNGTAVTDNPFYDGTNSIRSKVWLYGVRNPFRFSIQAATSDIWFGDVGWNTWEEINHGIRGGNYGWPCYEGNGPQPTFQGNPVCTSLPPNAVQPPFHTYDHSVGSAAIGGPFYTGTAYPSQYLGNFFFADYSGGFIKRVVFDTNNNPVSVQPFATSVDSPVSMAVGPDGLIYYLSFNSGEIRRIRSSGPSAAASANPTSGYAPLTVAFSSAGTQNPGGGPLTYLWVFGDGATSTAANPSHTYTSSGVTTYHPTLTVTNSSNQSSVATTSVTVGSVPPTPTISTPADGTTVQPGQTVSYQGSATDPEDGTLAGSAMSWTILLHHNTHVHTFVGGSGASGSFVAEDHGPIGTFSYEIILTATDSSGLSASTSVNLPVGSDTAPPSVPSGLTATAAGTQINLGWSASTDNVGVTGYRVERCSGANCSTFTQIATPTGTTYNDPGLAPTTSYSYRVRATDAAGNLSGYSTVATATTGSTPTQPAGLVAGYTFDEGAGTSTADASGNANTGAITGATWVPGKYGQALNFNGTTDRVRIPSAASLNLTTGITLAAWVKPTAVQSGWRTVMQRETDAWLLNASNSNGNNFPSGGATVGANNFNLVSGTTGNPVNTWTHITFSYDGTTMRLYINGTQIATKAVTGAIQTSTNPLWIGGNNPYGEYFQGAIDEPRVYNRALTPTEIQTIMNNPLTPPAPDTTPPTAPASLTATAAGTQINLAWSASSDNVAVAGYRVERCQGASCTNFTQVGTPTGTTFSDPGLAATTTYRYRVRAVDTSNNLGDYSPTAAATTTTAPDTTPPTAPSGLTATAAGTTQVNLSWTASTDNVGVAEYRVERCSGANCTSFAQVGTTTTTSFASTVLTQNTTYRFRVRAADAVPNLSAYSNIASATTATADTTRPSTPTNVTAVAAGPTQINVSWTASTDNVGVTGYRVERCQGAGCTNFAEVATPTVTTFNDAGRSPSTTYRYRVRATDAGGNLSTYSSIVTATTPAVPDTAPPSVPSGLTATAAGTQINLGWSASTDNVGVTGYRVERCSGANCSTFTQIATPTGTTYNDPGLAPTTSYSYRVRATDAAGNLSGYSTVATATTGSTPTQPAGLVAGYTFDEGAGTSTADASGNANTGAITGATWVPGKYGQALNFNGTTDRVRIPSAASLNLTTGITLAAWVKPTAVQSGWRTVMQRETDAWLLNASNSNGNNFPSGGATVGANNFNLVSGTTGNPVNTWTHITFSYDGTTMRLYINGTQIATKAVTGAIQTSTNPLWIGGNNPYGEYFQGAIDEPRVYNRALTPTEIQTIMNNPLH